MGSLRSPRGLALVALAALVAVVPLALVFHQPFWVNVATRIAIYALAAAGLDLIVGYGGLVGFGHAAFFALGGYTVAVLSTNGVASALVTWPLAVLCAAFGGVVFGALSLRTSGIYFIMITLAFAQMLYYALVALKPLGGNDGMSLAARSTLPGVDVRDPMVFYIVVLIALAAFLALKERIVASPFGMVLAAARQSERRTRSLGFAVFRYQLAAFVIAAAVAGLAGAMSADFARFVSPDMASWQRSGDFLITVILGGAGTPAGAIFGSAALIGLESALTSFTEHWMLALGIGLLLFVIFARGGIAGLVAQRNA